jgi:hypothetical protein
MLSSPPFDNAARKKEIYELRLMERVGKPFLDCVAKPAA